MALDTTIGGAAADSYASLVEADAYHVDHPHAAAWDNATDGQKEWALRQAARLLDRNLAWTGAAASSVQALAWPRTGMVTRNGYELSSLVVPRELKEAQSEFARQLLESNRLEDNEAARLGLTQLEVGSINLRFRDDLGSSPDNRVSPISDAVLALLVESWWNVTEETWIFKVI